MVSHFSPPPPPPPPPPVISGRLWKYYKRLAPCKVKQRLTWHKARSVSVKGEPNRRCKLKMRKYFHLRVHLVVLIYTKARFSVCCCWFFCWFVHFPTVLDSSALGAAHTPIIASRHLPPNSARFSYGTEGALFISAQLSTDAVSALRKAVEAA